MGKQSSAKISRPRFGVAGAAAMVAVCVTALALTAGGPTSRVSGGAAGPVSLPAHDCPGCGRALAEQAGRPADIDRLPAKPQARCSRCGR